MFGIKILTKKKYQISLKEAHEEGERHAMVKLVELLRQKDKIYLEPVTIIGSHEIVQNCAFLSTGSKAALLTIVSPD